MLGAAFIARNLGRGLATMRIASLLRPVRQRRGKGEPFGFKLDKLVPASNGLTIIHHGVGKVGDVEKAQELFRSRVLDELGDIRGALASAICGLGVDFEFFGEALIGMHLDRLGFPSPWIDVKKTIVDRQDPEKTIEVGVYSEEPFLIGECTVELYSATQIDEFLEKVSFVKSAVGREEEPKLFFFANRVDDVSVKEAAVKLLEEAGCHWYIAEETSKDL